MSDHDDLVKCPFCQGHGELHRAKMIEILADASLLQKIQNFVTALKSGGAGDEGKRTFFQDVHTWNPKLPLWRRSPKE